MSMEKFGVVVIGRNEGDRLRVCLQSVLGKTANVVYVDSGSTDDSVSMARGLGATVVELDMSIPFTAARARNEGFRRLRETASGLDHVQFVDGDCQVADRWFDAACESMRRNGRLAAVCGRRRERFPEQSTYNLLCDMEWDTPTGFAKSCGGDALIRVAAFEEIGGYNPKLIAGEEPEMCVRLRRAGWQIERIGAEMTLHDANMHHFSQWWKRTFRSGHAYAEGASLHGAPPERHWVREVRSNWIWGGGIPLIAMGALLKPALAFLMFAYPLQMFKIYRSSYRHRTSRERRLFAIYCMTAKLPQMLGQLKFTMNSLRGKPSQLIEYK